VFAGAVLVLLLGCQLANRAGVLLRAGEVSETLKLPYPWLMYGAAFGLFLLARLLPDRFRAAGLRPWPTKTRTPNSAPTWSTASAAIWTPTANEGDTPAAPAET
jgi:hypothetical protein